MKELIFAIGDIHGQYKLFKELISYFDSKRHQLVLIGDLNDRGLFSKECLLLGKQLVEENQAIYLRGNHEEYLLQFLKDPENVMWSYLRNGGLETIESLLHKGAIEEYSPTEISMMIQTRYKTLVGFLEKLPFYYEWKEYIFVHAGVDLTKGDWKKTAPQEFMWIREPFFVNKNRTGKTIVFGHTITPKLYGDMQTTRLWIKEGKIGIDGGGVYGGSVHGVLFTSEGIIQDIELQNNGQVWQPKF